MLMRVQEAGDYSHVPERHAAIHARLENWARYVSVRRIAWPMQPMFRNARARRWAPVVGLCGQPFWIVFALQSSAWGLLALSLAYSAVYVRGALVQWRARHG